MSMTPVIQRGVSTLRLSGEKILRTACCKISEIPNVANSVSSGRPYRKRITPRSMSIPTAPDTKNAAGTATSKDKPM